MNYQKEDLKNNQIKLTFEASREDWAAALDKAYVKTRGRYNIAGFRKGKAPRKKIEAMYGVGVFFEDALDIIVPDYYRQCLDLEPEIYPVAHPDFDILAISDADLKFSATVTVKPEVKLGEYKGLELKKITAKVTKKEVDEEIEKARERAGSWESVDSRAAENGDKTVIDYSGSVNGVKFDGGTAEKQELTLGSGMFIPGFEEQVVGMKIGESKEITVKFPEDYGETTLAGQDAVFAVTLHEIKVKSLPKLDDEFAKDVSQFDTLEAYKKDIKENLLKQKQTKADTDMEDAMMEAIVKKAKIDLPDVMVENEAEEMVRQFEYRLMYQGMKADDYYKYTGTTRDELMVRYMEPAKKSVLTRLVMEAIIREEKMEVSDAEVDEKLADFAKGAGKELEEYKKTVSPEQLNYIKNEVLTDKLLTFLKNNNKFA